MAFSLNHFWGNAYQYWLMEANWRVWDKMPAFSRIMFSRNNIYIYIYMPSHILRVYAYFVLWLQPNSLDQGLSKAYKPNSYSIM